MDEHEPTEATYGARVYRVGDRVLVKQTVLRGDPPKYVVDDHRERHAAADDDKAIAEAVRLALAGKLRFGAV